MLGGRDLTGVYLSPSESEGIPSYLLVAGPLEQPSSASLQLRVSDLYTVPWAAQPRSGAGLAEVRPVATGFVADDLDPIHSSIATDSRGRLLVPQYSHRTDTVQDFYALRIDLAGGVLETLEPDYAFGRTTDTGFFRFSPARTVVCVYDVFDLEGGPRAITDDCDHVIFVGEDLYYLYSDIFARPGYVCGPVEGLCRLRADGLSELVFASSSLADVRAIPSIDAHKLLMSLRTTPDLTNYSLLDADTLAVTPLPPETGGLVFESASPDGHWLQFEHVLYNWSTGNLVTLDASLLGQEVGPSRWRPGHNELWISDVSSDQFAILTLLGDASPVGTPVGIEVHRFPGPLPTAFTSDGRYSLFTEGGWGAIVYLGAADHPDSPRFAINPRGVQIQSLQQLSDGRLLVQCQADDDTRSPQDISVVDPDTGVTRVICSDCKLVALGQYRALLLLDWALAQETGNLALLDLDTFAQTRLAESVYAVAIDRGQSASVAPDSDALAPGTQAAFLVRNRLVAPYDGLWVAKLP